MQIKCITVMKQLYLKVNKVMEWQIKDINLQNHLNFCREIILGYIVAIYIYH